MNMFYCSMLLPITQVTLCLYFVLRYLEGNLNLFLFMQSFVYRPSNGTHWVWLTFHPTLVPQFMKFNDQKENFSLFLILKSWEILWQGLWSFYSLANFANSILIIKLYYGSLCLETLWITVGQMLLLD